MRPALLALICLFVAGPALADDRAVSRIVADYEAYLLKDDPFPPASRGTRSPWGSFPM